MAPLISPAAAGPSEAGGHVEKSVEEGVEQSHSAEGERVQAKQRGEELLRASGLTYFIVRPSTLADSPGGRRQIAFSQQPVPESAQALSRADVAEVAVRSLLDPRACNVACALYESEYVPSPGEGSASKQ